MKLAPYFNPTHPKGFDETQLPSALKTPMMLHYISIKAMQQDALVFYRLGDFYEMFFEDAEVAAKLLDLTLTSRSRTEAEEDRIPMCGVPHHAAPNYIQKLTAAGYRVALCDQVEDAKEAKGMVRRDITRVITPSLVYDPMNADSATEFFLDFVARTNHTKTSWVHTRFNTVNGQLQAHIWGSYEQLQNALSLQAPQEIIVSESDYAQLQELGRQCGLDENIIRHAVRVKWIRTTREDLNARLCQLFSLSTVESFGFHTLDTESLTASYLLLRWVADTQRGRDFSYLTLKRETSTQVLEVDAQTFKHLQVFRESQETCLVDVFTEVKTGLGKRQLLKLLARPACDASTLQSAHALIGFFVQNAEVFQDVGGQLESLFDLERLAQKASSGTLTPGNMRQLVTSLRASVMITEKCVSQLPTQELRDALFEMAWMHQELDSMRAVIDIIDRVIEDVPGAEVGQGKVVRSGVNAELDRAREVHFHAQEWLNRYESTQRERTGISSLKVKFNKSFGFSIEISKANVSRVPEDYQRRQTLVGGERYVTPELLDFERRWLVAQDSVFRLEIDVYRELCLQLRTHVSLFFQLAVTIASLDVARASAHLVAHENYVLPEFDEEATQQLMLQASRHPVLEFISKRSSRLGLSATTFVPNNVACGDHARFILLTGPNMSGKSTLMRQAALCVLLAHAGLPVPASQARLSRFDRLFTRIGASDKLNQGQSTFMVEMVETASILRNATAKSFVLIDEIGRGTSTYDGMSIAWAVAEDLIKRIGCTTFFATHYHELVKLEEVSSGVRCAHMAIKEWQGHMTFLWTLQWGACEKSYGINVARLAGLPSSVVKRAQQKLDAYSQLRTYSQMNLIWDRTPAADTSGPESGPEFRP